MTSASGPQLPTVTTRLIECSCFVEGLQFQKWSDGDVYVALWKQTAYLGGRGWRQRLRHIWQIIRHGDPWADEIMLTPSGAGDVVRFLLGAPEDAFVYWTLSSVGTTTYPVSTYGGSGV